MQVPILVCGGIVLSLIAGQARADCWIQGADPGRKVDLALFVAGLNHLYWPNGDEAAAGIAVDEPIRFLADEIKQRYPLDSRLIVAITGNKHTTNFPDNTNHPADRLENLLRDRGVRIGGSVGQDQFRLIHGPEWRVQEETFVRFPPALRKGIWVGFYVVKLRAMIGDIWDWRTPDLQIFMFRPHPDDDAVRAAQLRVLAQAVHNTPTNYRTARPILVGDANTHYPTHADANELVGAGFDWITYQLPCGDHGPKIYGADDSDLMNVLIGRDASKPLGFKVGFIGFQVDTSGAPARPFQGIAVPQLGHNVVSLFLQRTGDATYCAPREKLCADGSCRRSCPVDGTDECPPHWVVCPCTSSGCAKNTAQCNAACNHGGHH